MIVDTVKFQKILDREISRRSQLETHTLDWYTYDNRIALLEEVQKLFTAPAPVHVPKSPAKAPKVTSEEKE